MIKKEVCTVHGGLRGWIKGPWSGGAMMELPFTAEGEALACRDELRKIAIKF